MAVKKRNGGSEWSFDIKVEQVRWRRPCSEYIGQRQYDPVWRAACRLPEGAPLTDKRTIERYIESQARLDLISFVSGNGPDPRLPPPAPKTPERAVDLVNDWYTERTAPGDGSRPITSTYTYDSRVRLARLILGDRPATDLLSRQLYADIRKRQKGGGGDQIINSVLRPCVRWAQHNDPPRLDPDRNPFDLRGLRRRKKPRRTVEITQAQREALREAFRRSTHADAGRVSAFFEISLAAGPRPFELALIRRTDLDFARGGITFRAETTKTGEARTVPLNPHGPYMAWLQSRRFGHGYIFEPLVVGKGRPRRAAPSLKVVARSITDSMRTVWRETLANAGLADAGLWMRDTRRTCAIHWRRCGVPKDDRQVLLGHAADVHDGYALTDFEGLQSRLQQFVWSRERAVPETAVAR